MRRFAKRGGKDQDVVRIAKDVWRLLQQGRLYLFLRDPRVSWTSNGGDREIWGFVVHRTLSGGRRTWRGSWVLDRLMTVSRTCRKRGVAF